jgi:hypothetical protein
MPAEWFADTDHKTLGVFIQLNREMTPGQRLARISELCELQQALQTASVRSMYPQAGDEEVFLRVAARRLGRELMMKVYNWCPDPPL